MAKTSISLSEHFEGFIATLVSSGRYDTANEVVRVALCLLEQYEMEYQKKLSVLRDALIEGEQSDIADEYSLQAINQKLDTEYNVP